MKFLIRTFCVCVLFLCCAVSVFAIPGIKDYVPTESGQYVIYRDYSFKQETYIGFLFYDDYTFSLRYISPNAETGSKNIELLVSLNKEKDAVELSGEKIITSVTADDVEVMNYLHDLLYEFSARRKKINERDFSSTVRSTENFYQFGGDVTMYYDFFVPIFNLRGINDTDGKRMFDLVRMGILTDNTDTSFTAFKGIPVQKSKINYNFTCDAKAVQTPISVNSLSLNLDSQWTQTMENVWMLGVENSVAIAMLDTVQITPNSFKNIAYTPEDYLIRLFLLTQTTMPRFSSLTIKRTKTTARLETTSVMPDTAEDIHNVIYFIKTGEGQYSILSLTVFDSVYSHNKQYFEQIIDSAKQRT